MEITITATVAARIRTDLTICAAPASLSMGTPLSFAGGVGAFAGGMGHFGGECVVDVSAIKPSDNADNRAGTDWSPPV